jgi:hypothetical protein
MKIMMKKLTALMLIAMFTLVSPACIHAGIFSKKKKQPAKTDTAALAERKQQTPWDKLFKGKKVVTEPSDFITLHKTEGKLYFEIPLKYLDREMLLASTLSEITTPDFSDIGYKIHTPLHIKFTQTDSLIYLRQIHSASVTTDNLQKAVSKAYGDPILYAYPVKAYNKDSSAVVIDMTALFVSNEKILGVFPDAVMGGLAKLNVVFKKEGSYLDEIKSFKDNLSIKSVLSYSLSLSLPTFRVADNLPVTAKVTRSFLLLPEEKMTPRISDSRVGIFNSGKRRYTATKDKVENYSIAHRWRVEPKDMEAYKRGELVEPVKPIIFYVDDAFPELWKAPVKEAIERWNVAFEKIGFKNVIQAIDFPQEDSEFDPDNLKYSCVRYLPSTTANAMGPSWVDPATGEIINASVIVYGNIVQLINNWRFVQTAQVDPRVRNKKMPDDIIKESISYVITHEIGHCLGFMHNMAASSAFSVESLRSPEFTSVNGTTPCIMDYARFNYIAQPGDQNVRLTPPDLGIYDYFLVKWNYQYLPEITSEWEEQPLVEKWVDEKAGDPVYRYGRQQIQSRYDPSAIEEDLGDNPIKAGEYGIKNLKYILANLEQWISDDNDYSHRQGLYSQLLNQYYRYLRNVVYNIGGIYLTEIKEGTPGERHAPVPEAMQKTSLQWVLNEYKNAEWIDNPLLKKKFPLQVDGSFVIRDRILKDIKGLISNVLLSAHHSSSPYTVEEFTNDLYQSTWSSTLKGTKLTNGDKILQQSMVDFFCESLVDKPVARTNPQGYAPSVDEIIAYGLDGTGLVARYADVFRQYDAEHGYGTVAQALDIKQGSLLCHSEHHHSEDVHFGTPGYGWQGRVSVAAIDDSKAYLQDLAVKSRNLLRSRIAGASGNTRTHYLSLLVKLNTVLKDKI